MVSRGCFFEILDPGSAIRIHERMPQTKHWIFFLINLENRIILDIELATLVKHNHKNTHIFTENI